MGKQTFWTASFQCLAKSLCGIHLIKLRICKWLPFQCTSASCNCQHWSIVHWVGRGGGWGGAWLYYYSGCFFLFEIIACIADHQDSPPPPELPSPAYKSTPRKRITTSTITTRQHRRHDNKGDHAAFNGPEQTDSVEVIAVKEPAKVAKEEASICGPHIQILLAVLVFLVFISFLVYSLMEDTPRETFKEVEWSHGQHQRFSVFIFRNMW